MSDMSDELKTAHRAIEQLQLKIDAMEAALTGHVIAIGRLPDGNGDHVNGVLID
jgi:hypothetical protein